MREEDVDGLRRELAALRAELADLRRAHHATLGGLEPVLHALPTMVWVGDAGGHAHYVNPAWLAFRGTGLEDELGLGWLEGVHPEDRQRCLHGYQGSAETGDDARLEYRLRRGDGQYRWMLDACGPQRAPDGRVVRYVGTATDVTEQVESRALLDKVHAAQRVESLGLLAGGVAHDFNNMLTGIMGNVELALEDIEPDHPVRPCLEDVALAARTAAEMISHLLTFAGRRRVRHQAVDLNAAVMEAWRMVAASVPPRVRVDVACGAGLPAVAGDPTLLCQVVLNLVLNAVQACDRDGHVAVRTEREADGRVALVVQDDGRGMDPATRARIFEPYFTTRETGRGLGLASVHGIVAQHGASIEIASAPGEGARFTVRFSRLATGDVPLAGAPTAGTAPLAGGTILLIDDDSRVLRATRRILERRGYTVACAEGGRPGLALIRELGDRVSLVLLDLTMPDLDGAEVLRRLRTIRPHLPVVLTSGYAHEEVFGRIDPDSVSAFLHKPFTPVALTAAIEEGLGH
jgi:two-component system cell cycle sensor histidine kinase/response regulator CckA